MLGGNRGIFLHCRVGNVSSVLIVNCEASFKINLGMLSKNPHQILRSSVVRVFAPSAISPLDRLFPLNHDLIAK